VLDHKSSKRFGACLCLHWGAHQAPEQLRLFRKRRHRLEVSPALTALAEHKITLVYCFIDWFWEQHVDIGLFPLLGVGCSPKLQRRAT
jgi:hypothetical protein